MFGALSPVGEWRTPNGSRVSLYARSRMPISRKTPSTHSGEIGARVRAGAAIRPGPNEPCPVRLAGPLLPLPIYSAPGACFKPPVVPHNAGRSRNPRRWEGRNACVVVDVRVARGRRADGRGAVAGARRAGGGRRDAGRGAAMTGHAVVVAGGGPTGLMLARRSTIGSSRGGRWRRSRGSPGSPRTSATFPRGTTTGSGCGSTASWPVASANWRCHLSRT
jgi:hypothetical protein